MSFFNSLYNSLYNFKWLRQQKDNTSWAWSYFFLLVFLVSGLIVLPTAFNYFSQAPDWKEKVSNEVPDFRANIKGGKLEVTNLQQPYIKKYDNLVIVVDTISTGTLAVKQFVTGNEVGVLATTDRVEFYNPKDKTIKIQDFSEVGEFSTDRAAVLKNLDIILSKKMMSLFTLVFSVTILLYLLVSNLLNVFFFGLVFYQYGKRKKFDYTFRQIFNVGLFAITLPLILSQLISGNFVVSLILSVMIGVWMYLALFKEVVN